MSRDRGKQTLYVGKEQIAQLVAGLEGKFNSE